MSGRKITTILVDDETLAREGLALRLAEHSDVQIIDQCKNGREAIRAIKTLKPDLVFLDVQMPGFDGFAVVEGLMDVTPPLIIFVTAFDDFALKAFAAQAVDYLLKPLDEVRLADALNRVRARLAASAASEEALKYQALLHAVAPELVSSGALETAPDAGRFERMINIKDRGQIFRVDVDSIERVDAAGDYMCIHTGAQTLILRETMKDMARRLDPKRFRRVHRSTIVNLDLVKEVRPHANGECFLVLASGAEVKVSRSYRDVVARFL